MPKEKRTLVVVADGARVRFFVPNDEATKLIPARAANMPANDVHRFARDVKSDKPGRTFSSSGGGPRHAIEPHHDYHKLEKHKFSATLAKILEDACARGEFDQLVLIAPRRSLGELRGLLAPRVQSRIAKEIPKDLTKLGQAKLWALVSPLVKGPRAGAA